MNVKKHIVGITIAVLAFAGGYLFVNYVSALRPLTLCEVISNDSHYKGREVRVRVWLQRNAHTSRLDESIAGFVSALSACSAKLQEGGATVIFTNNADAEKLQPTVFQKGEFFQPRSLTQALIIGILNFENFDANRTHCFAPKYRLENARLEAIESVVTLEDETQFQNWMENNLR